MKLKFKYFLDRIAKCFWRYGDVADPPRGFRPFPTTCLHIGLQPTVPIAVEDFETAAAELRSAQPLFRRRSRIGDRALLLQLRQIVGRRPTNTRDSRLPFRGAP